MLPHVLALQTDPVMANVGESLMVAIVTERRRLMDFYQGGLSAGDRKLWAEKMGKVLSEDRSNPYYLWFLGRTSEEKSEAVAHR